MILVAVFAIVTTASTYAILSGKTGDAINDFKGPIVNIAVNENGKNHEDVSNNTEEFKELQKKGDSTDKVVKISNLKSDKEIITDAYIRVKLLPVLRSDSKSDTTLGMPIKLTYEFQTNTKWVKDKDETYYYTVPVKPGESTEILLKKVTLNEAMPKGYHLELQVLSDAIVTRPDSVLKEAWGIENFDGMNAVTN